MFFCSFFQFLLNKKKKGTRLKVGFKKNPADDGVVHPRTYYIKVEKMGFIPNEMNKL